MLGPPKKRKLYDASIAEAVDDLDKSEDDLDESEDVIPDWHASFDLQSRAAMLPEQAWVQEALDVSTKLRARELKDVMWWDAQALNPERAALYALPHLNYTHNTGVVEFSVPPACCQPLASFLDEPSSYNVNGWLVMAGRTYPGYAKYPYVHSRFGQVSSVQEVRTPPRARLLPHTTGNHLTCPSTCLWHRERRCECLARQPATSSWRSSQRCVSS